MASTLMVVVYNQSSEDVWVVNRSLSQGSWIAVHDAIPKGYSYVTVAYNASGYISGSFNINNKSATNTIANARFSFSRGVKKSFELDDQKQDELDITYKVVSPQKFTTDDDTAAEVNLQSTLTALVFINDV